MNTDLQIATLTLMSLLVSPGCPIALNDAGTERVTKAAHAVLENYPQISLVDLIQAFCGSRLKVYPYPRDPDKVFIQQAELPIPRFLLK